MTDVSAPERIELAPGLTVSRIVTGLWQVADMERDGKTLDPERAAANIAAYAEAGFDTFDMADHYGSAEVIAGRFNRMAAEGRFTARAGTRPAAFTKWCPSPGPMTADVVRAAVDLARVRHADGVHRPPPVPLVGLPASRLARRHARTCPAQG